MLTSDDLTLSVRLGLLRAVCERHAYFAADQVHELDFPLATAIERYGSDGVPALGSLVYARWGHQPIIAGLLTAADRSAALPYLRCAAVAQQTLGSGAVDMLLVLIGPEGSRGSSEWASAAAAIEDDDRICRKLVWLPGGDPSASAEQFLSRSPFARPWRGAPPMESQAGALDTLIGDKDTLDDIAFRAETLGMTPLNFLKEALSRRVVA